MGEKRKKTAWKDMGINKLLIMLGAGVLLVLLSFMNFSENSEKTKGGNEQKQTEQEAVSEEMFVSEAVYEELLEKRLKSMLELVNGVGNTEVMITIKASGEQIALTEKDYTGSKTKETDNQGGSRDTEEEARSEIVIYKKNSDGSTVPYIIKEKMPEIEGVVVIAEGGGNTLTVNNIIDAVMALFDVPIHKIKVLEMKLSS